MGKRLWFFLTCLMVSAGMAFAQKQVTGIVTDIATGEPLIGVHVKVNGQALAITDANGKFVLNNVAESVKVIEFSCVGFEDAMSAVKSLIRVAMAPASQKLDDVMVIAYGATKRSSFTGSATEIKAEDIAAHVASSATSALVGNVTGLTATNASGGPGSSPSIKLRGIGSMAANSNPLYIVDGAPYELSITTINPQDIANITVLKDAAACAIYGARGANGVILITTKKGQQGNDAEVKFDAKWGSNSRLVPNYDVITDPAQYYETHYKAMYNSKYYNGATAAEAYAFADANLFNEKNGGLGYQIYTLPDGEKLIGTNFKLNPHAKMGYSDGEYFYTADDWYDETFHNSFRQEYTASVNGKSDRLNYYGSVGFLEDGGSVNNSVYKRYTGRVNVDYQAKEWLKLTTNLAFTHSDSQTPDYTTDYWGSSGNLFYVCNNLAPIYPLYVRNADGSIKMENGRKVYDSGQTNQHRANTTGNAVRDNEYDRNKGYSDIFYGNWRAVITPVKGLDITGSLTANSYNNRSTSLSSAFAGSASIDGYVEVGHTRYLTLNKQLLANYTTTFNDIHNFNILAGYEAYNFKQQSLSGANSHLYDPFIGELNNAKGDAKKSVGSSTDNKMNEGYFGRVQYDYDDKYFADASIRRDGSSIFAPGHRWGTFGSVGLGWQMQKEAFLQDVDWIDLLKLKVSYGVQGNDNLGSWHPSADMYSTSWNKDTGEYSIIMAQKGNEKLTWETSKQWNIGVDFGLFNHRLIGTIEFYNRHTTDLLYMKNLPLSSGLNVANYPVNLGAMVNRGIELSLDGTIIKNKTLTWRAGINLTHNYNEITDYDPAYPAGYKSTYYIRKEGGSIYDAYMYKFAGVDKTNGQALYYMDIYKQVQQKDENGNLMWKMDDNNNPILDADGNKIPVMTDATDKNGEKIVDHTVTTNQLDQASMYNLGTTLPDLTGGFNTSLSIAGFDISAQFSFQLGGKIYDGTYQALMHNGSKDGQAMHKDLLKAWSYDNQDSNIPRLSSATTDCQDVGAQSPIDRYLTSSDYLALNNLAIAYNVPQRLIAPYSIRGVRVYVAGENLLLLSKRKGLDPRYNYGLGSMIYGSGRNSGAYASMRTITAGLTLTF